MKVGTDGVLLGAWIDVKGAGRILDIGTGTGLIALMAAQRAPLANVTAIEPHTAAFEEAKKNVAASPYRDRIDVVKMDANHYRPTKTFNLIVCNPPWLPARPTSAIERAVYDEDSRMLKGFLAGLLAHLEPKGEGWLILSNMAEHLGLRSRDALLALFEANRLRVVSRVDAKPVHPKASDTNDALHHARSQEVTSLWRLAEKTPNR